MGLKVLGWWDYKFFVLAPASNYSRNWCVFADTLQLFVLLELVLNRWIDLYLHVITATVNHIKIFIINDNDAKSMLW